jgi:hypothetical protein
LKALFLDADEADDSDKDDDDPNDEDLRECYNFDELEIGQEPVPSDNLVDDLNM